MVANQDLIVFKNPTDLAEGAAHQIANFVSNHPRPQVTVAMAGGSTPAATYRKLKEMDVPWNRVVAWMGDERYVPPGHPDHNGTMVDQILLASTQAVFHHLPWDDQSPQKMADTYEKTLHRTLEQRGGKPCPDLVLAGIGDDGHTLSLFPGSDALHIQDRDYTAVWVKDKQAWRLTATLPLVHRAEQIFVLVSGAAKAPALAKILHPTKGEDLLPAARLMEGSAPVTWLVDSDATSKL